ncbi:MAG: hypothetical protein ACE1ZX_03095 [Acidimicrobiia bacterium]
MSVANLIGAKTGILHDVKITGGEIEDVSVGDRTMAAKHYVVTGTSSLTDLWYDGDLLVKFIVKDGTTPVSVWLQQPSADTQ